MSNALTVVLGWLDVARARLPQGSSEREALEVARTHARLGYGIARQAIGAEVPEAGSTQCSARATARTAVTGVTPEANRRGIELVLDASDPAHALISNAGAALQILTNLLFNALAFTPRGRRVTLSLHDDGSQVVFSVKDQGPGIAEERAESIFDGPVSTRRGGAGVGLKHSHALATAHGGRLTIAASAGPGQGQGQGPVSRPSYSRPPPASTHAPASGTGSGSASASGACFELRWPIAEARSSTRPQRARIGSVRGARVLVVEDDAAVRSLIELALEARGVETTLVASAAELAAALVHGPYDVALIDLSPIADQAAATFARLRACSPGISVILISGVASGVTDDLEREVAAWVRKPFEMGEVVDVMARLLASRAAQAEAEAEAAAL